MAAVLCCGKTGIIGRILALYCGSNRAFTPQEPSTLALTRRRLLQSGAFAAVAPALGGAAAVTTTAHAQSAAEPAWRHGLSLFGDLKYPADFKRYDHVNPDAPK